MKRLLAVAVALAPVFAAAEATTWKIDPAHSSSGFAVKHLVVSTVRGQFGKTTGTIQVDDKDITKSKVDAQVDVDTLTTGVGDRDNHLKSPDFFDAANNPTITFKSTKVAKAGGDKLKVTGDLTMKGKTKPVTFDATYSKPITGMKGEARRAFNATTTINRKDFGLNWSKTVEAGPVVSDKVVINIDVEATKATPEDQQAKAGDATKEEKKDAKADDKK
ncbi:MAG: YceI family protein [Anaeromyxobacteraceae bacterium]